MNARVVNKRVEPWDVYIGRGSPFGCPFEIGKDGDRDEVISLFRDHFAYKIAREAGFREQVIALDGKRLGCFCKPHACHGDVIKEYIENVLNPSMHGDV